MGDEVRRGPDVEAEGIDSDADDVTLLGQKPGRLGAESGPEGATAGRRRIEQSWDYERAPVASSFVKRHSSARISQGRSLDVGGHVKVRNSRQASTAVSVSWSVAVSG